jgi:putative DNA methylase
MKDGRVARTKKGMTTDYGAVDIPILVPQDIEEQKKLEGVAKTHFAPISTPIVAKAHTPVYNMHRFFARRPFNVFETLVKHYTSPGDIVLDPFMGGGVTVVESLRARRRVIGVDLNPMAWFIVDAEVRPVKLGEIRKQFIRVEKAAKEEINQLYEVACSTCGKPATTRWSVWSTQVICPQPDCNEVIVLAEGKKLAGGRYVCPACKRPFNASDCRRLEDKMVRITYDCPSCGTSSERVPTTDDLERVQQATDRLVRMVEGGQLSYPQDMIPDGDRVRDDALYKKGYTHFYDLFTRRNLLANAILKKAITNLDSDPEATEALLFVFSSSLSWSNKMRQLKGGWGYHGYWLPDISYESNVWDMFRKQFNSGPHCYWKGKTYSNREFGQFAVPAQDFSAIADGRASYLLLCRSSHELPLPDNSVDVVITDPPFGGNVQYAELADFWAVWLKEALGLQGIIDNTLEAIETRHKGFPTEKSLSHYEEMLFRIFKECHRVLKADRWMVLTFHNRDLDVWMALHRAANRAGFKLPSASEDRYRGMLYQPPIEHYTTTLHQRATGSMLGDFILSFKREKSIPYEMADATLSTEEERELVSKIQELIKYHAGADDNLLMTGLIPYLTEKHIFHKIGNKDFKSLFNKHFVWMDKEKKWFTKDMVDPQSHIIKPIDYVPAEKFTEEVVYSFLKDKKYASLDDIISVIYRQLVNSHKPGIPAISKVLQRICDEVALPGQAKRKGYTLRPTSAMDTTVSKPETETQLGFFGPPKMVTTLSHNEIIELVCSYALGQGYDVHVGETEQNKEAKFKRVSRKMTSYLEFGLPAGVFDTIVEIDVLLLKGSGITHAFEVATTVETANKAVNDRYRNMFIAMPSLNIKAFLIVKDKDVDKAHQLVYSLANVKDGISQKVKIVRLSDLTEEGFEKLLII